MAFKKAGKL